MRRKSVLLIALWMTAVLTTTTACGSGANDIPADTSRTSGQETGGGNQAAGDAADVPADKVITLTLFDKNTGDAFTNPVSQEIIRRTGINIEILQPTGNPDEVLNLMLASGDLPDIVLMDRREATLNRYIANGALIPLNDLMNEHAPNIVAEYGDVLAKSVYEDGYNYYFNNWYGLDPDPNWSIAMRMDLLREFGLGDRAMAGDAFTQDEFVAFLRWFKETYPGDNVNPALPLIGDASYMPSLIGSFQAMYGMKNYHENGDRIEFIVRHPRYLEMLQFINMLLHEELMDPEWGINNGAMTTEKEVAGRVAARLGNVGGANNIFMEDFGENTEHMFYQFTVTAPGVSRGETTFGPRSSLGWDGIGITVSNQYPVETIKLLDFLASEEGQTLLMWGVEGQTWNWENGVRTPTPGALDSRNADWAAFSLETGARKWTWMVKNGYFPDGTPRDFMFRYQRGDVDLHGLVSMAGTVWDTALYDDIGPTAGTPEALSEQIIRDAINAGFASIVNANPADVETMYNRMIAEIDAAGAAAIEDIFSTNFAAKMALYKQWN